MTTETTHPYQAGIDAHRKLFASIAGDELNPGADMDLVEQAYQSENTHALVFLADDGTNTQVCGNFSQISQVVLFTGGLIGALNEIGEGDLSQEIAVKVADVIEKLENDPFRALIASLVAAGIGSEVVGFEYVDADSEVIEDVELPFDDESEV
jgi:hypothetical protein